MTINEIKKYIKIHKIRHKTISEKSGIPLGTIRNILSNADIDPRASTLERIEKALEIDNGTELAEIYYTTEEERVISEYRSLSARDKRLIIKLMKEMNENY